MTQLIIMSAEIASNAELFVVGVPTQLGLATQAQAKGARLAMCGFMGVVLIARQFGIARYDLFVGSRRRHSFFAGELPLAHAGSLRTWTRRCSRA